MKKLMKFFDNVCIFVKNIPKAISFVINIDKYLELFTQMTRLIFVISSVVKKHDDTINASVQSDDIEKMFNVKFKNESNFKN